MKNIVLLCHMLACVTSFGQSQEGTLQVTYPTFDQSLLLESTSETSANIAFGAPYWGSYIAWYTWMIPTHL